MDFSTATSETKKMKNVFLFDFIPSFVFLEYVFMYPVRNQFPTDNVY